VALSHNSYAQVVAARHLGIPTVTAMDFEHQPANHLAFRLANTILLPEVLTTRSLRWQGARPQKVIRYPGLKEELYIGEFRPDAEILSKLGLDPRPRTVAAVRTPPSRAVYHPSHNPLFEGVLRTVCEMTDTACVVLPRHPEQVAAVEALGLPNCVVPRLAIDSRSLIYASDAFIGAGGTMTREAALMGIPTWTMFAGDTPAVDSWLERRGVLTRLTDAAQLAELEPRRSEPQDPAELRKRAGAIERVFVDAILSAGSRRSRHGRDRGRAESSGRQPRRRLPAPD
jgi:predicted glycosyltransferase